MPHLTRRTLVTVLGAVGLAVAAFAPSAAADPAAPGAVTDPVVRAVTGTSITVGWTAPASTTDITGYRVDFSTADTGSWTPAAEVDDPSATSVTVTGLTPKTTYDLRVLAFGPGGDGPSTYANAVRSFGLGDIDSCVVLVGNRVRCWGAANPVAIDKPTDIPGLSSSVKVLTSMGGWVCALRTNGDVTCGDFERYGTKTVFAKVAGLPHDVTDIANAGSAGCALSTAGSVWCWGYNYQGELGIGSKTIKYSDTAVQVPDLTASSIAADNNAVCAVRSTDARVLCWGEDGIGMVGDGGGADKFSPTVVNGFTGAQRVEMGYGSGCAITHHVDTGFQTWCWGSGDYHWDPNPVQLVDSGYSRAVPLAYLDTLPCETGPPGNACFSMSGPDVVDVATDGWETGCGVYSDAAVRCENPTYHVPVHRLEVSTVTTAAAKAPSAPPDVHAAPAGSDQATLSWLPPLDGGSPLTGYVVEHSTDGGATWTELANHSLATSRTVALPDFGRADLYRVSGVNSVGQSDPSEAVIVSPGGTGPQQLTIRTPDGAPVSGGAVTWQSADGTTQSAVPSALTADGVLTFARVVAGSATVTITDGVLPNGTKVSGSWPVTLGTDPQVLHVAQLPDIVNKTVTVTLPNGVPVVNASVRGADGFRLNPCITTDDAFTFCGGVSRIVLTDGNGDAHVSGWATEAAPTGDVVYSDGVLAQRQSVPLPGDHTTVQLQYMPWLTVNADGSPVDVGQLSTLAFAVNDADQALSAHTSTPGVAITVKPPTGWSAKRCSTPSVLSGTTNSKGRLSLHVCASTSGVYQVVSHGAVTTKSVLLRVRGAAPMAPTSLTTRSPHAGVATASWAKPVYAGGAPITAFRLTATSPNQPTRTATVNAPRTGWTAAAMAHRFTGLTSGHVWTIKVAAVTRHGAGNPVTARVTVA